MAPRRGWGQSFWSRAPWGLSRGSLTGTSSEYCQVTDLKGQHSDASLSCFCVGSLPYHVFTCLPSWVLCPQDGTRLPPPPSSVHTPTPSLKRGQQRMISVFILLKASWYRCREELQGSNKTHTWEWLSFLPALFLTAAFARRCCACGWGLHVQGFLEPHDEILDGALKT